MIRDKTTRHIGQVRMINLAAFDQPDEAFMIRILDSQAMAGTAGVAATGPRSTSSFRA